MQNNETPFKSTKSLTMDDSLRKRIKILMRFLATVLHLLFMDNEIIESKLFRVSLLQIIESLKASSKKMYSETCSQLTFLLIASAKNLSTCENSTDK